MSKELVIGSNRHETKVAILEDDQLVEIYFQRANEYSLAGSIHKGRVTRVLPGMQSAFVDLGLERDTFLYVSDFFDEHDDIDTVGDEPPTARSGDRGERGRGRGDRGERNGDRGSGNRTGGEIRQQAIAAPVEVQSDALVDETTPAAALRFDEEVDLPTAEPDTEGTTPEIPLDAGLSSNVGGPPSKPTQETSGDRGEREDRGRGDRRHRRRRNRGRGFPENKYAHPGDSQTSSGFVAGERPSRRNDEGVEREPARRTSDDEPADTGDSDVIILPGESLAKYRRTTGGNAPPAALNRSDDSAPSRELVREAAAAEEPDEVSEDREQFQGDNEEEIEAEAEELALTDRIFSHNDGESADDVEEKIDEAAEDAPPSNVRDEQDTPEDPGSLLAVPFEPQAGVESAILFEDAEPLTTFFEARSPSPFGKAEDELTGEDAVTSGELASETGASGFPPASEEIEDGGESGEEPGGASQADMEPDPSQPRTAELREGSQNRPLQRSSRRTRRRRGGHRNDRQPSEISGPGGGNGTAPAASAETEPVSRRAVDEERTGAEKPERALPSISDLLKTGQEIIVQIAKEPLGQKGARITSHVALPGRYVVFMPSVQHLGVSRKIASDEERQRLKRILQANRSGATGGFIVRTAGEGVSEEELSADMNFLYNQWLDIRQKAEKKPAPTLLHYDLNIVQRILRDQVTDEFKAIWIDSEDMYENVVTFMQRFQPALVNRVKMYTRSAPIFDAFNVTAELEKALRPKVWLKSGGYIVINQTEALVAIDINTGKYVGKSNRLEDTIVKTNTEAVKEIVRQIRLRDLGGIIVVDFIDMDERKNRQKVMQALEEAMRADKAPYKILQFNDFGLVAITRKRVKQSLERTLCAPCLYCDGAGYVKSVQTVIGEILTEAQKLSRAIEGKDVMLRVHPEVAKTLKAGNNKYLEELEEILGRPVLVKGDPALHTEKFDLG